ncbi:MAG: hypothetical protein Q8L01_03305 [Candidatus Woesebacteria bacterium]|nr:hypothetical protein [Candidatus Woesebacteria bacterium]
MDNLKKFIINSTNEFHILRHYKFVDNSYKETLISKPYWYYDYSQKKYISSNISKNDVECALETIGTKFYENIKGIENPKKLLELIEKEFIKLISKDKIHWTLGGENKVTKFSINFDSAVGMINVLSINSLSNNDKKNIKSIPRSKCTGENNVIVNTISGIELGYTNMIYVEIIETTQLPFYIMTAFPDCSSLDSSINDISDDDLVFIV